MKRLTALQCLTLMVLGAAIAMQSYYSYQREILMHETSSTLKSCLELATDLNKKVKLP